jgi:hypothetical protein
VAEVDNPLLFPDARNYTAGDGTVLALGTNAMRVSDYGYGTHPLFIFATDGVWTLNVGAGDVLYSTLSSPASEEVPVSGAVCATPYGVVYISQRGLMLVSARGVEFISPDVEETAPRVGMELPVQAEGVVLPFPTVSVRDYILGADFIMYNPHEAEIIIRRRGFAWSWALSLPARMFYRSTERIDVPVANVYPELYGLAAAGGLQELVDYARSESPRAHVCLTTRPLRLGTDDIKKLDRVILRGVLYGLQSPVEGKKPVFMVWSSDDGDGFMLTRGVTRETGESCKDVDTGLLARTKHRYFIVQAGAVMEEDSRLLLFDVMVGKEYFNEKMR